MSGLEKGAGGLKIEGMMDGRESKTKINENYTFWVISTEKKWTMYLTCINCTITVSLY